MRFCKTTACSYPFPSWTHSLSSLKNLYRQSGDFSFGRIVINQRQPAQILLCTSWCEAHCPKFLLCFLTKPVLAKFNRIGCLSIFPVSPRSSSLLLDRPLSRAGWFYSWPIPFSTVGQYALLSQLANTIFPGFPLIPSAGFLSQLHLLRRPHISF